MRWTEPMLALSKSILRNPCAVDWIGSESRADIGIAMVCWEGVASVRMQEGIHE